MLELRQHKERVENIQRQIIMQPTYSQLSTLCGGARLILLDANEFIPNRDFKNLDAYRGYGDHVNSYVRWYCNRNRKVEGDEWDKLYWQTYLNGARARIFNDYLLFLERKRDPRSMFYKPKIKQFEKFKLIEAYQGMLDDRYDRLCISLPPGTGKTTLLKFFHSAIIGWFPEDYSLFCSHSGDITRMYYDGVYQMIDDTIEYAWSEIFPGLKITSTNALMQQFNVGTYKPFPSLQTTSIGANSSGKVRANKYLLSDDLIGNSEQALNKNYLDKIWRFYSVDAKQRKTVDSDGKSCKEIIQATRWSTQDVIGRVIILYQDDPRTKIISVPAVDPITGESNFNYAVSGFTKEFFADQELTMDEISYKCLFMQEPIEREGLLFPGEKIQRYKELPKGTPELITAQCDTKSSGTDFFVLPVFLKYGNLYYCVDCICSNSTDYEAQYENSANILVNNKVMDCEFESNNGGDRVSLEVDKRVLEKGWICNISSRATETNKEARIFQCSNWILQNIVFKDMEMYKPREPYGIMMSLLAQYSATGKKQLDDVPDTFANFALRIQRRKPRPTRIINSIY
nr:MAG TPA: Terminase [Bacteriophage sp.]